MMSGAEARELLRRQRGVGVNRGAAMSARRERQIRQIAVVGRGDDSLAIIAVCTDGSAWMLGGSPREWRRLPAIPMGARE